LKKLSIIIICIIVFFASGCNNTEETVKSSTFGFETDKITILRWKDDALQDNELEKICDIEDKEFIEKITNALKSEEWEEASLEKQIAAVPEYYISFNNGTLIKLLGDISYGHIMNYTIDNGLYNYFNGSVYYFPETFLNLIKEEVNKSDSLIKDHLIQLDKTVLKEIVQSYFLVFEVDMSFEKEDYLDFEKVFYYISSAGTYPIQPIDDKDKIHTDSFMGQSVRPELYQYFNDDTSMMKVPTTIVDEYISSKFNTRIDHSQIKEYDQESDSYIYYPFMGGFNYDILVDEVVVDGEIVKFSSILTQDVDNPVDKRYQATFVIKFVDGEYTFLSVKIKEII
jgi:hypothetical protein